MSLTNLLPQKLHRRIEIALKVEKDSMKDIVKQLRALGHSDTEILVEVKACLQWLTIYGDNTNFIVAFQLYTSCLKQPA